MTELTLGDMDSDDFPVQPDDVIHVTWTPSAECRAMPYGDVVIASSNQIAGIVPCCRLASGHSGPHEVAITTIYRWGP